MSRIRSGDDTAFVTATFELILFALLTELGCTITIHPDLPDNNRARPDFLVITPDKARVYIEAVLASEHSTSVKAAQKRTKVVLQALERIDSPDFFVSVRLKGDPVQPPNGRALRKHVKQWLATLDPDVVASEVSIRGRDAFPKTTWQRDGWTIGFQAIPRRREKRDHGQRTIGAVSGEAHWSNVSEAIRDSIKAKGNRYGELSHPLLVAVNVDSPTLDSIDEMQALFGEEAYVISRQDLDAEPERRRKWNGAWLGPHGPQYTRVSGVWIFGNLNPWNVVSQKNTVFFNPWASQPLSEFFEAFDNAKAEENQMVWNNGRALSEILALNERWPSKR